MTQEDGRKERDKGMRLAEEGAGEDWNLHADHVLRRVAESKPKLTTDDLRAAGLEDCPGDPRALGAVMARGARKGWVQRTDVTECTERAKAHRRPLRVWTSLLWRA